MPRTCIREGCGQKVLDAKGHPSLKKIFCSNACSLADHVEKIRLKRNKKVKKYQWIRINGKKKIGVRTIQAAIRIAEGFAAEVSKVRPAAESKAKNEWKKESKNSGADENVLMVSDQIRSRKV